jgi:aryl-alcohol dehydrogenase-like predicted oxidoreductase
MQYQRINLCWYSWEFMPAPREIPIDRFVFGCHRFGFGPAPGGGAVDVERHVVPMVKTALDLGIRTFDSAVLYRATLQLGRALELLGEDPQSIRFQTKCLRYLGLAADTASEHQPEALLQGIPARYQGLTDRWDGSAAGVEQQICRERIELGGRGNLHGVALHDPPDMEKQVGLNWESDVRPAVRFLQTAKAAGFVRRIGLGIKEPEFVHRFVAEEPGVLDYAGVTFCPAILAPMMKIAAAAQAHRFQVTLMGINYGQAFTLTSDPATAAPFLYNYEVATAEERALMSRFFRICGSTPLLHLAAAVAGLLAVHFPGVVTQIVTSTMTPTRLVETVKLVREAEVPAPVWRELKTAGLVPVDFPTS